MLDLIAIVGAVASVAIATVFLAALTAQSPGSMVPFLVVVLAVTRWLWRRS